MPQLLSIQPRLGTIVSVWKISEDESFFISQLQLNEAEKKHLQTICHSSKRLQWLSSRLMIRQHLNTPDFIELQYLEWGQPKLVNFEHHISISHTADVSAVIVSKDKKVGVDIEQSTRKVEKVAHKFISDKERAQRTNPLTLEEMMFIWGAKESLYKFYGHGQVDFRKHLWVKIPESISEGTTEASIHRKNFYLEVKIHYQKIDEQYLLCWVAE